MFAYELVKVEGHLTDKDRPRDKAPRENKVYTAFLRKESLNHQYLRVRPLERAKPTILEKMKVIHIKIPKEKESKTWITNTK